MATTIKKFSKLAVYAFFLVLTAFVSALFGNKKSSDNNLVSLIPSAPTARADVPTDSGCTGSSGSSGSAGSDCDTGSDSGDCCE